MGSVQTGKKAYREGFSSCLENYKKMVLDGQLESSDAKTMALRCWKSHTHQLECA